MTSDLLNGASFAFGAGTRQEFGIQNLEFGISAREAPFSLVPDRNPCLAADIIFLGSRGSLC
ncbi:hypothetical protein [Chroococcidiopsis sp. SAG 2025]|uniref:hypothetical protein n=1 Tax=Chroococcidiopsis sp. SAG 2025 TaxID=171389 RepID=UPI0029373C89|nr:hypothetical protein [Chroococcidiopsis sp. SAG 2025]